MSILLKCIFSPPGTASAGPRRSTMGRACEGSRWLVVKAA